MRKIAVIACLLLIAGCAAQPAPPNMDNPGFWWGLLHGLVAPFSLIGSFFDPTIRAYAAPNSGWWYDLGFVLGLFAIAGGSGSAGCTRTRPPRGPRSPSSGRSS